MTNNELEEFIAKFSTEKLLEIITVKANSYDERFLDFTKDELIKRNVKFNFNPELVKEAAALSDSDLKELVEQKNNDYHLEYIEVARDEYLKRGFKNESKEDESLGPPLSKQSKYPALVLLAKIYHGSGWVCIISIGIIILFAIISNGQEPSFFSAFIFSLAGAIGAIMSFGTAEMIKLFVDIESNTRK